MTPTAALAWKEWHDARTYLFLGLGLFLGLPLVGAAEQALAHGSGHPELQTTPWVVALGGVLAVFVGVGVTVGDRRPKLEDFWRSRPVRVGPWLAVKYAVALAVVLVCCGLPPLVAAAVNRHGIDPEMVTMLTFMPFFWTAIFSLAFLAGCLVARPSHAATLALAAMLLVYLLPVVLPPLSFMNVADFADRDAARANSDYGRGPLHEWVELWGRRQFAFAAGMLVVSATAAALAAVGVARGWRVESGRRTLYGLVATALLLLFASAAFQLGTNLPVVQTVTLRADEEVCSIRPDPGGGYDVIVDTPNPHPPARPGEYVEPIYHRHHATVGPDGLTVGPPTVLTPMAAGDAMWDQLAGKGPVKYWTDSEDVPGQADVTQLYLDWGDPNDPRPPHRLPLWRTTPTRGLAFVTTYGDALYLLGIEASSPDTFLVTMDVGHGEPRFVSRRPFRIDGSSWRSDVVTEGKLVVHLWPLPGVPPAARLAERLRHYPGRAFDGHLYVTGNVLAGEITAWRLARLDPDLATFDAVGHYRPTLLRRLSSPNFGGGLRLGPTGLAYVEGWTGDETINSGIAVLDTAGPRPLREVAHFAAPGVTVACPLPDGRALVAGHSTVWLVAAPRRAG